MPTTRKRRPRRHVGGTITDAAIEAYRAGDVAALHDALALAPWDASPLKPDAPWLLAPPMDFDEDASRQRAIELRAELEATQTGSGTT